MIQLDQMTLEYIRLKSSHLRPTMSNPRCSASIALRPSHDIRTRSTRRQRPLRLTAVQLGSGCWVVLVVFWWKENRNWKQPWSASLSVSCAKALICADLHSYSKRKHGWRMLKCRLLTSLQPGKTLFGQCQFHLFYEMCLLSLSLFSANVGNLCGVFMIWKLPHGSCHVDMIDMIELDIVRMEQKMNKHVEHFAIKREHYEHDRVKPHAVRPKAKHLRLPSSTFRSPLIFWTPLQTDYPIMCTHLVLDLWWLTHCYRWLLWHVCGHLQLSSFNSSPDIEWTEVGAASSHIA